MTLCECGCGEEVKLEGSRFKQGHNLRVNNHTKGKKFSEEARERACEKRRLNEEIKEGKRELPFCKCGCGERVKTVGKEYILGHNRSMLEHKFTEEQIKHISDGHKGITPTEETREKLRKASSGENNPMYGIAPWNKGLTKETDERLRIIGGNMDVEKIREVHRGNQYRRGEKHTEATKKKMSEAWDYDKHITEEAKQKWRETTKRFLRNHTAEEIRCLFGRPGEKSPSWRGGISYEPYCNKFNADFRERVRVFFNRRCYICGITEEERGERSCVHHVNYDKMVCCNDVKPLFVPLCRRCHTMTGHNREEWEEFFTVSLEYLTGGECFIKKG